MSTNRNNKRFILTERANRRLKEMSDEMNGAPPPPLKAYDSPEPPELPDVMWGRAVSGIPTGTTGGTVTLYRFDVPTNDRVLLTDTIIARTYGSTIPANSDVLLFRVPGFWLAVRIC